MLFDLLMLFLGSNNHSLIALARARVDNILNYAIYSNPQPLMHVDSGFEGLWQFLPVTTNYASVHEITAHI